MAWLTAGCVRCSLAAAREKLRSAGDGQKNLQFGEFHGVGLQRPAAARQAAA